MFYSYMFATKVSRSFVAVGIVVLKAAVYEKRSMFLSYLSLTLSDSNGIFYWVRSVCAVYPSAPTATKLTTDHMSITKN